MTMRERMLAVIRGEELDRVPFAQYRIDTCAGRRDLGRDRAGQHGDHGMADGA